MNINTLIYLLKLCKLKVVALILLTAIVGMLLATPNFPNLSIIISASAGISLVAASAAVFNHIIDKQIDIKMARTNKRPLPQDKINTTQALIWGIFLGTIGLGILYFFVNTITTILTFASLIIYAVIYSIYLKHATPQNIVIGGVAGAAPPILGWTAVVGMQNIEYALLLFLIVFIWTPPHFWALAIHRHEEYKKAKVPMLSVTHGLKYTRIQILLYTTLLFIITLLPYITGMSGIIYLTTTVILSLIFLRYAIKIYKEPNNTKIAFATFKYSINYLIIIFISLIADHYIIN